ncbi:unnamed protein product [marine sediment metagenome]|uniref:Uncharacterized protein n=1 Tax=marine sediment metagenome TaxID=412755 RepID=X0SHI7_9ZZZZ
MSGLDRRWRREASEGLKRDRDVKPAKHWKEQEEISARAHGGEVTHGSGCSWRPDRKLDSVSERWRMSSKTTGVSRGKAAKSIRFEREWLEEARRAAQAERHQPVVAFGFDPDHRDQREDWVAIPLAVFKRINEVLDAVEQREDAQARALLGLLARTA